MFRSVIETGEPRLNIEIHGETATQPGIPSTWLEHWDQGAIFYFRLERS